MIHQDNKIDQVKEMIESKFGFSVENNTGIRTTNKECYSRRIFINLLRGYFYTPLKIIEAETGLCFGAINYHIRKHKENRDKEYNELYKDCLESFKKLFYENLTITEKIAYHEQQKQQLINSITVNN